MENVKRDISVKFCNFEELGKEEQALVVSAISARKNAYAPYSKYLVGAAVWVDDRKIFRGCNVERSSYTQTTHAEQNALDTMITECGNVKVKAVCVVGAFEKHEIEFSDDPEISHSVIDACVPCGHCLQIIWEHCKDDANVKIIGVTADGYISITTIGDVFPVRFGPADLGF